MSEGSEISPGSAAVTPLLTNEKLLIALVDYLRSPLVQISREAELALGAGAKDNLRSQSLGSIKTTAGSVLRMIDTYLLNLQANSGQISLDLEPLSLTSVLNDTAHLLSDIAKLHRFRLRVVPAKQQSPAMAHRASLISALSGISQTLIEASRETGKNRVLTLTSYAVPGGLAAGVFGTADGLSEQVYRQAKALCGQASMPIHELAANSGAGVFLADSILGSMSSQLRVARRGNLTGLAATFHKSYQLSLV